MSKSILVASLDENYLMNLVTKMFCELDEYIDIKIITNYEYLLNYINGGYATEQILIIGSDFFYDTISYVSFENVVILSDDENKIGIYEKYVYIYKFLNVDSLYDSIINQTSLKELTDKIFSKETSVVALYSPVGGSGKTTFAYGLCYAFAKAYKKVLYVNVENLQAFGYLFDSKKTIDIDTEKKISNQDEYVVNSIKKNIQNCGFDFIPPLRLSMYAIGITIKNYSYMIDELKASKEYDFIVIDMPSDFNCETSTIIGKANKVINVITQEQSAAYRMNKMLDNVEVSDNDKFLFICNKYQQLMENYLDTSLIKEYVEFMPEVMTANAMSDKLLNKLEHIAIYCM